MGGGCWASCWQGWHGCCRLARGVQDKAVISLAMGDSVISTLCVPEHAGTAWTALCLADRIPGTRQQQQSARHGAWLQPQSAGAVSISWC